MYLVLAFGMSMGCCLDEFGMFFGILQIKTLDSKLVQEKRSQI